MSRLVALWLGYCLIAGLLYWPTRHLGYVVDYIGWWQRVEAGGLAGIVHAYDYAANLQLYALLMWATVRLREWSETAVYLLTVGLFSGASVAIAALTRALLRAERARYAGVWGAAAGLLYALSPVNTEIVAWKVCLHYSLSAVAWCVALFALWSWARGRGARWLALALGVHAASLFVLEYAYALPIAAAGLLAFVLVRYGHGTWARVSIAVAALSLGVTAHLALTYATEGALIGHYGHEAVSSSPLTEVLANPWRYIARYLLFTRHWAYAPRVDFNAALASPLVLSALYVGSGALAYVLVVRRRARASILMLLLFLAGAGAAAVSTLYFWDVLLVQNDRMGALCGLFACAGLAAACALLPRWVGVAVLGAYLGASVYLLREPLAAWRLSGDIVWRVSEDFRALTAARATADDIYLVGYANSAVGAPTFSDFRQNRTGLGSHLAPEESGLPAGALREFFQYNQGAVTDSVHAEWHEGQLLASLSGTGSWWQRRGLGLTSYRDTAAGYTLTVHPYHVAVAWDTPPPPGTRFFYQVGLGLRELPYPAAGSPQPGEPEQ